MAKKLKREQVASKLICLLREERKRQGLSMTALAEKSGLSLTMISFVEREMRHPTLDTLQRIAGALEVSLSAYLRNAESEVES